MNLPGQNMNRCANILKSMALIAVATCSLSSCAPMSGGAGYSAEIRRTEGGIAHIKAGNFASLGFGTGYAMAEDNICQLADQYMTLSGQRSRYLGPSDGNLESDFLYQLFVDRGLGEEPLTGEMADLFQGAADGYNDYLNTVGIDNLPDPNCRGADWVHPITALEVRRVSRVDYAFGHLLPLIIAATPPGPRDEQNESGEEENAESGEEISALLDQFLEIPKQGGSNAIALGKLATVSGRGMLLANPHQPWDGDQRFYPMHQTIPGVMNVAGANLIGRPRVGFGHSEHVAWTSTVSTAKRLSFYQLKLVKGNPIRYWFDGKSLKMGSEQVTVMVKMPDKSLKPHRFTFYSTHFGLMIKSDYFDWDKEHAYALRLPDVGWRGVSSSIAQYSAKSVREFKAVNDREQFLPVNLIAVDSSGEVLFSDPGAVPNVTDEMLQRCGKMYGAALDGSISSCQWQDDWHAAAPGLIGPPSLPSLFRHDYVTNSNDSYWLANPAEPLENYGTILGNEKSERTLRTRSGLTMVRERLSGNDGLKGSKFTLRQLQTLALANQNYAGQMLRNDLVRLCRANPEVTLEDGSVVDLKNACEVLATWDLYANLDSRGAHLFRQFMSEANRGKFTRWMPEEFNYAVPFDVKDPVNTPRGLDINDNEAVLTALGRSIKSLESVWIALDARLGDLQFVTRNGNKIPIHGGPEYEGVFNKIEAPFQDFGAYSDVTGSSSSWIMATEFTDQGPRARGILTYSISVNPESPHYDDQTKMFSKKQWLDLPFYEKDVEAATLRKYVVKN